MTAAGRINVRGEYVDVELVPDQAGTGAMVFTATWNGTQHEAPDWKALQRKLVALAKGLKVAVPFFSPQENRSGVATGLHVNRNVLVRWNETGRTDQIGRYEADAVFRALTLDEMDTWRLLVGRQKQAIQDVEAFKKAHRINLVQAVQAAVRALEAAPPDEIPDLEP